MFQDVDLRQLAEMESPERAFVSLYLSGPESLGTLGDRAAKVRALLAGEPAELEHFEHSLERLEEWLATYTFEAPGLCAFSCFALDYLKYLPLSKPVGDLLWVDSSPYIRPLAELQDEYETFVLVAADNSDSRIFLVTSAVAEDPEARIKGDVKNHVKKGGWSQKRYQRRRGNELMHYAKEVAEVLGEMEKEQGFRRIVLAGSQETVLEIRNALPPALAEKVAGEATNVDLKAGDEPLFDQAFDLFFAEERASEERLWERIRGEYCRGGLAAAGPDEVLKAAAVGRVETMIVERDVKIAGTRCRDCENLSSGALDACPVCHSESVFKVDLVNELVELLAKSSAEAEFADPVPGLAELGGVAALLRY